MDHDDRPAGLAALLGAQTGRPLPAGECSRASVVLVGPELAQGAGMPLDRPGAGCAGHCSPSYRSRPGVVGLAAEVAALIGGFAVLVGEPTAGCAGASGGAGREHRRAGANHAGSNGKAAAAVCPSSTPVIWNRGSTGR